jgi:hypothetical protein
VLNTKFRPQDLFAAALWLFPEISLLLSNYLQFD